MVRVAIATPSLDAYSETFIRTHIERLPADIVVLYGGTPPALMNNGQSIVPSFTLQAFALDNRALPQKPALRYGICMDSIRWSP